MPTCICVRVFVSFLAISIVALGAPATLRAQGLITISGIVSDASGGVLPGATVETVVAGRRVASASTDAEGRYRVDAPAGVPIELRVQLDGFAPQLVAIAGRSQPLTRDVVLPVAGLS